MTDEDKQLILTAIEVYRLMDGKVDADQFNSIIADTEMGILGLLKGMKLLAMFALADLVSKDGISVHERLQDYAQKVIAA
jgi:hypothetical protein